MNFMYQKIRDWATDRDIIKESTPKAQFVKLVEEWGEIDDDPIDGVGDSLVVLIILAAQYDIKLEDHVPTVNGSTQLQALGVLANAISKNKAVLDAIKLVFGQLHLVSVDGHSLEYCLNHAYEEIKDRKGKMISGTWVKEQDL